MKIDVIFALIASLLNIAAFTIYNWRTYNSEGNPNTTSWALWALISALNFTSYRSMTRDWMKSLLPTVSGIQCILTFFLTLRIGELRELSVYDFNALWIGGLAGILWWKMKPPPKLNPGEKETAQEMHASTIANICLQAAITIGFIPTFEKVWMDPQSELPLSWFLWTASFFVQLIVVVLRWRSKKEDLVYPINCLWMHAAVGVLSM